MNPMELAQAHLRPYKIRGNQVVPKLCPFCGGGQHQDKESFAMSIETGAYNCKRGSCGVQGSFKELCEHFREVPDRQGYTTLPKRYEKPSVTPSRLSQAALDYAARRRISPHTLDLWKVGEKNGAYLFPFYERGEIVFVKYRPIGKIKKGDRKAWREPGGKPVLWGIDRVDVRKPLIIVEGEFDALACTEAGLENVVSVPSGTSDQEWVNLCWDTLEKCKTIILFGDQDDAGQQMIKDLIPRLGEDKCKVVSHGRKDANELLLLDGPEAVRKAVAEAKEVPVKNLIRLADVQSINYEDMEKVLHGFPALDNRVGGQFMGALSVWTGLNGGGKSTLLGQVLLNDIDQGYGVCAYSGELPQRQFKYWVNLQASGIQYLDAKDTPAGMIPVLDPKICRQIEEWYYDKFFLYDSEAIASGEEILKAFEMAVRRYGCRIFLIDNLMTTYLGKGDIYEAQKAFTIQVKAFARKHNVHVHMVAHPRKVEAPYDKATGQKHVVRPTKMDISGTGDLTNLADNVYMVHRVSDYEKEKDPELEKTSNLLVVLKDRMNGTGETEIRLNFEPASKRFYQQSLPMSVNKQYGWVKDRQTSTEELVAAAGLIGG
jgi:twinkle protein